MGRAISKAKEAKSKMKHPSDIILRQLSFNGSNKLAENIWTCKN